MRLLVAAQSALLAVYFAGMNLSASEAADSDTNLYTLDLTGKGTLTDVYKSGLRPRRWDNSSLDRCFVEDRYLAFSLPQTAPVNVFAAHCEFRVLADGRLESVVAQSPDLTIDAARQWMRPIVTALNGSQEKLDRYLDLVSTGDRQTEQKMRLEGGGSDFSLNTGWPGSESDRPALSASLRWRWDKEHPIAFAVMVSWARPYSALRFPTKPIEAPPGFEQFPLRTDPFLVEAERRGGAAGVEHLPHSMKESSLPQTEVSTTSETRRVGSNGPANTESAGSETPAASGYPTLILIVFGMCCFAVLWVTLYRKSSR